MPGVRPSSWRQEHRDEPRWVCDGQLELTEQLDLVDAVQRRQTAARACREAEEALAVELALCRAATGLSARDLASITGLTRREVGRLVRMAARSAW